MGIFLQFNSQHKSDLKNSLNYINSFSLVSLQFFLYLMNFGLAANKIDPPYCTPQSVYLHNTIVSFSRKYISIYICSHFLVKTGILSKQKRYLKQQRAYVTSQFSLFKKPELGTRNNCRDNLPPFLRQTIIAHHIAAKFGG